MKFAGRELEPSLFSSEVDKLSLNLDDGRGDPEGLGDREVARD